jgi:Spy/CpxP family protein refolding chaperone
MRKSTVFFLIAAIALSAPFAWAQRQRGGLFGGGFGGGIGLLGQQSVQQELKLSADQIKQVDELLAAQRESFSGLRDLSREDRQAKMAEADRAAQAKLASILKEDQLKRFKQISLQQRGAQAFTDPEVATALALSDEQKSKIADIQSAAREEMRGLFQGAAGGDREELRKKFEEARTATNEKLMGVLSPEQQAKWKELTGEPFKGEIRRGFRRAGGDGNRAGRNRPDNASATIENDRRLAKRVTVTFDASRV